MTKRRRSDRLLPRSVGGGASGQAGANVSDPVVPAHGVPVLSRAHAGRVAVGEQGPLVVS